METLATIILVIATPLGNMALEKPDMTAAECVEIGQYFRNYSPMSVRWYCFEVQEDGTRTPIEPEGIAL